MNFKKVLITALILFIIICLVLFFTIPKEFGYYSHKIITIITFGLI